MRIDIQIYVFRVGGRKRTGAVNDLSAKRERRCLVVASAQARDSALGQLLHSVVKGQLTRRLNHTTNTNKI